MGTRKKRMLWGNILIAVLVLVLLISWFAAAILGVRVIRLSHTNLYTQNVDLSNVYFLSQFREEPDQADEDFWRTYWENPDFWDEMGAGLTMMYEEGFSGREIYREAYAAYGGSNLVFIRDALGLTNEEFQYVIEDVPYLSQEGTLPNGCEAVSAVMLLQHRGFETDPVDFVEQYLPMEPVEIKWGCRYGPDPNEAYAGDPASEENGWGCFAPVIIESMEVYLSQTEGGSQWQPMNLSGQSLDQIFLNKVLFQDTPVAIWVTIGMEEVEEAYQWQSYDKDETYLYPVNQHCMVLIGGDAENYYLCDPYEGNGIVCYPRRQVEISFLSMGSQAVALMPASPSGQEVSY